MSCLSPSDRSITARPKLTLQTTSLPRTFGTSNTGLSLSFTTGPTASPTVRNTFKNAYDVPSPSSATSSPSKGPRLNSKPISPYTHTSNHSFGYRSPYQVPIGVRSILRNSPLEHAARRRSGSVSAGTGGPGAGARRVFFPAKKSVNYRHPLEEEIRTERYTAQHLDLVHEEAAEDARKQATGTTDPPADDSDSSESLSETSTSGDDASTDEDGTGNRTLSKLERKKRRTLRIERQVRAVALLDGLQTDPYPSTPQTPLQGRAKRRREWKWTLGPIDTPPQSASSETPSVSSDLAAAPAAHELQAESQSPQ
ncbi:hypothetical protein N7492_009430 [Penicillium capsulatum]|uniref:Uncharacterized protein n=1 Tax=Penicillium capsulatum TaxID=69766 RepID=A0A9W9LI34_9EURO|nr:hypothetical protein N7492_009430 [Penicillium capsulatum]KAJ6106820.1 hypothetical protein N7512_010337 [Penicillium capsulatum]